MVTLPSAFCYNVGNAYYLGDVEMKLADTSNFLRDSKTIVSLHLCHWNTAKTKVTAVSPTIGKEFVSQIRQIALSNVEAMEEKDQETYNIIGAIDGTVEVASTTDYQNNVSKVVDSFAIPAQAFRFSPDNFDFFVYVFAYMDKDGKSKNIYCFKRTKKLTYLNKGFMGRVENGTFKNLTDMHLLATDGSVDLILTENDVYIFQHISFERIFHLKNEFLEKTEKVLMNEELGAAIENFDALKNAVLGDSGYVKRLAKLSDTGDVALFTRDLTATKGVIEEFQLDIRVDTTKEKIIFDNDKQAGNFVKLMQDSYYKTLIGHRKGIDDRNNTQG